MDETPTTQTTWFGFERVRVDYKNHAVDITVGEEAAWDRSHLRRLRQSSDLPGLVPVIDADLSSEGRPYVVTAAIEEPTLTEKQGLSWNDRTGITEAVARVCHEAHDRGLFHGALSPDDVYVIEDEVAVDGLGLTLGGDISDDRTNWVAPEVLAGDKPTARSDVYSLGKLLEAVLGDELDSAPRSVKRLIMWSSSDTPEARPRSASEFAEILSDGLGEDKRTYRPAFIPTIRANDLTADAEKAVADAESGGKPEADAAKKPADQESATSPADEPDDTSDPDTDLQSASDPSHASVSDDTGELKTVDLPNGPTEKTDEADLQGGQDNKTDSTDKPARPKKNDEKKKSTKGKAKTVATAAAAGAAGAAAAKSIDKKAAKPATTATEKIKTKTNKSDPKKAKKKSSTSPVIEKVMPTTDNKERSRYLVPLLLLFISLPLLVWALSTYARTDQDTATSAQTQSDEQSNAATAAEGTADPDEQAGTPATDTEPDTTEPVDTESTELDQEAAGPEATEPEDPETETTETESTETESTETESPAAEAAGADVTDPNDNETEPQKAAGENTESEETDAVDVEDEAGETEPNSPSTEAAKAIPATDAAVQILHGIPQTPVDVYVDDELTIPDFRSETLAGPVELTPGSHDIAVFAADDQPGELASERSDKAVIAESVTATTNPATLIAHLDEDGAPALAAFTEALQELDPGETRIAVRNLAAGTGAALVNIDGEEQAAKLSNGNELQVLLTPGEHTISLSDEEGNEVASTKLDLVEGELTTVTFIGSEPDTQSVVAQRYSGLSSAPASVPTGDSGLLGNQQRSTNAALLLLGVSTPLLLSGFAIARRRRRL